MTHTQRPDQGTVKRRAVFAGAATMGTLAAVASLMPTGASDAPVIDALPKEPPQRGGGYALTDHVKQYYQTTRV